MIETEATNAIAVEHPTSVLLDLISNMSGRVISDAQDRSGPWMNLSNVSVMISSNDPALCGYKQTCTKTCLSTDNIIQLKCKYNIIVWHKLIEINNYNAYESVPFKKHCNP